MAEYEYLKKYSNQDKMRYEYHETYFDTSSLKDIEREEKRVGFEFPSELKEFWLKIGYGSIRVGKNTPKDYRCVHHNSILRPDQIADILLSDPDSPDCPVIPEFYDYLTEGDMPFFEIGDSVSFLYMRPKLDNPNAVYDSLGNVVSKSLEEFIDRLYHESPTFYCESETWGKIPKTEG